MNYFESLKIIILHKLKLECCTVGKEGEESIKYILYIELKRMRDDEDNYSKCVRVAINKKLRKRGECRGGMKNVNVYISRKIVTEIYFLFEEK